MYLASGGQCTLCGAELTAGWHGDHIIPHSAGGATDVANGQALCPECNLKKGDARVGWMGPELRGWQREALDTYIARDKDQFLVVATPGAGKTTFALNLAHELLEAGAVHRIVVVVPTEHLKVQWAKAAHRCGISIDPTTRNASGLENPVDYRGAALTYAQVASQPQLHRMGATRTATLVILDEIHHAGEEKAWGEAVRTAFKDAARRLCLSGTPFRSDNNPIPFVDYGEDGKSRADYSYGYGRAIRDEVCRQVDFHFYDGEMKWVDSGIVTSSAALSADLAAGDRSSALETALDPDTGWMKGVLQVADRALDDLRTEVPDAGGLVIAYRGDRARAYASILKELTGEEPTVVLSEDGPTANAGIEDFAQSGRKWLIAVRMVSEGVDVPRLAVGVYATKTRTEMFFRQAVGRFVRRGKDEEHAALVFAPALPGLRGMAAQIEQEIQHEIDLEREEYEKAQREGDSQIPLAFPAVPLSASAPTFDRAIHGGREYTAEVQEEALARMKKYGFPLSALPSLRRMVWEEMSASGEPVAAPASRVASPEPAYQLRKRLKDKLNKLARRIAIVEQSDHKQVQYLANQAMGVRARAQANIQQLEVGIAWAQRRLGDR
jgi:superfamily II DNA or RNA helicase